MLSKLVDTAMSELKPHAHGNKRARDEEEESEEAPGVWNTLYLYGSRAKSFVTVKKNP